MRKNLMTLVAGRWVLTIVLCCWVTSAVLTACSDKDDNPVSPLEDVNKGIVINLESIVIKPYLQLGASLADVEAYMQENYADWTYITGGQTPCEAMNPRRAAPKAPAPPSFLSLRPAALLRGNGQSSETSAALLRGNGQSSEPSAMLLRGNKGSSETSADKNISNNSYKRTDCSTCPTRSRCAARHNRRGRC